MLKITTQQYEKLRSLYFNIGGKTYELTANAQIWPVSARISCCMIQAEILITCALLQRALNTVIGGQKDAIYLIVGDIGTPSGQGLDFINGFTFLERFYSVYDTTNKQVGLAYTPWTYSLDN